LYTRFAVYFSPEGPFAASGAAWLGWDLQRGQPVAHPAFDGFDVAALTARPRKYGFHGTVKAPFVLAQGALPDALGVACRALCADLGPVTLAGLRVAAFGRFLALEPTGDQAALRAVAARVVQELDAFRAPLTEQTLVRRRKSNLSAAQDALLLKWGYPHVMDQFRFHMTLTGPIPRGQVGAVQARAAEYFADNLAAPFTIDSLTLVGERVDGMFELIERFRFGTGS